MKFNLKFLLSLLFIGNLFGQKTQKKIELGIPKTTTFLPSDYNAEAQNFDFVQDEKGILYVANTGGFLEFNGVSWRNFKPYNDGVPLSFAKDSKGRIFTGGTNFLGFFDKNELGETKFVSLTDKLPKDFVLGFVWRIYAIQDTIYFQNDKNVIIYKNNILTIVNAPYPIQWLLKCNNIIYADTKKGLFQLKNNILFFVKGTEKLGAPMVRELVKNNNTLVAFTREKGLFSIKNNKCLELNNLLSTFLKEKMFASLTLLNDTNIAISSYQGGVLLVDNSLNPLYRISTKGGLTENNVKKVKQDFCNNLWIGNNRGITKINYPITTTFFHHNSSELGTIEEIITFKNNLILGSSTGSFQINTISKRQLFSDNHYANFKHLAKDDVHNFTLVVFKNKLFYGGQDILYSYDGIETKVVNNLNTRKLYVSIHKPNVMFVGHSLGCEILVFNNSEKLVETKKVANLETEIRGVAEDIHKNLWLASVSNGIFKVSFDANFENQKIKHFGLKDGLPSLRDNLVYNVNNNDVLFTTHKGLFKFDETTQKFVPETRFGEKYAGGKEEFIYAFNFDKNKNAWMHSFRKKIATSAIKDSLGNYQLFENPLQDIGKMQAYEILSEPDKNVVWYGGADGLARFDISKTKRQKDTTFYAVISKVISGKDSVLVGGHQFDKDKVTRLSASSKDIRFEVGATDFTNLKETKYQYFLEGYDEDWSDYTEEPFKIYTNLNYGDYTFKARAKNYAGLISIADEYSFFIAPFWYQTKWVRIIFFFGIIILIVYLANFFSKRKFVKRVNQLKLKQKYEQEKAEAIILEKEQNLKAIVAAQEEERGKIARELHDGVVQQIGSIILQSRNLFTKKNLIVETEPQQLLKRLETSNQDLRNISHQMMPIALKELGIVAALSDLLENSFVYTHIKYTLEHFNLTERLSQNIEITIYRITQELINNIIKHSQADEVSVQLFNSNNTVILIVEDNGVGFSSKEKKKGIGLLNISSRLNMVNGYVSFEPSPKSGTLVTINIPI